MLSVVKLFINVCVWLNVKLWCNCSCIVVWGICWRVMGVRRVVCLFMMCCCECWLVWIGVFVLWVC